MKPKIVRVLLDADGQIIRWPSHDVCDWNKKAALLNWLSQMEDRGISFQFHFVTNRAGSDIQAMAYDYRSPKNFSIVENGCVLYDHATNMITLHPDFEQFATETRPRILDLFRKELWLSDSGRCQEIGGRRISTIEIGCRDREEIKKIHLLGTKLLETIGLLDMVWSELGKSWVMYPQVCNKAFGLQWLEQYYQQKTGNPFPWKDAIWIADGARDIVAAEYAHKMGAEISANGGSNGSYLDTVEALGGIMAEGTYEDGVQEILEFWLNSL